MNKQDKVKIMTEFIIEKEKKLQENKLLADNQAKSDVVKAILDELERISSDENKEN